MRYCLSRPVPSSRAWLSCTLSHGSNSAETMRPRSCIRGRSSFCPAFLWSACKAAELFLEIVNQNCSPWNKTFVKRKVSLVFYPCVITHEPIVSRHLTSLGTVPRVSTRAAHFNARKALADSARLEAEEFAKVTEREGPLIPITVAARVIGCSETRVSCIAALRDERHEFFGRPYFALRRVIKFADSHRLPGRKTPI